MDDGSPRLEVGFAIDTGGSYDDLNGLSSMMDRVEARIVADAERIENATRGMVNTSAAEASITAFAATTSAAFNKAEQAAERMTFRLNEQVATFGMTRAAVAAWRAEQAGATDAARDLLNAEAALVAKQTEAAAAIKREADALRQASTAHDAFEAACRRGLQAMQAQEEAEAKATALARARADAEAATIAQLHERANIEAALARTMGADRPRATDNGATYGALAALVELEEAEAKETALLRTRAEAEAVTIAQLHERANIEAALARTMGTDRPRATDPGAGATYSALAEQAREQEVAEKAAAVETERMAKAAQQLRASIDPAYAAQLRFDTEMAGARQLISAGAISLDEYCAKLRQTQSSLDTTSAAARGVASNGSTMVVGAGEMSAGMAGLGRTTQGAQIEMLEMLHISRSLTEQIATGVNPLRALTMESGRFMTAVQYGGAGVGGFVKQFASLIGIIKTVQDTELAEAAASAAGQAAAIKGVASRAEASIAAAGVELELARAAQRVATTEAEASVVAVRMAAAYEAQAVAATQLKVAEDALAISQGRATEAVAASAAATTTTIGATGVALAVLAPIAATAFGAFKQFQGEVKDSGELTRYRDSLGLTHKEMEQLSDGVDKAGDKIKHLTDVTVTAGDVMHGLWKTIKDEASTGDWWEAFKNASANDLTIVLNRVNILTAGIDAAFRGAFNEVKVRWSEFPAVFGDLFVQGVNEAIDALNMLVKFGVGQLNAMIDTVNKIPGLDIGKVSAPQIAPIANPNAGAALREAREIQDGYTQAYANALKANEKFVNGVKENSKQFTKDRMLEEAQALKENETPKRPKKERVDHNALNAEATEAQIKNLYLLADAYKVSGGAALIAEARVKAESDAIKHQGDITAAVDRQVRLAIAQRVSDAEKSAAKSREEAAIQAEMNGMVAAGTVPAAREAELVKDRIADLPLLAAIEAAQQRGLKTEVQAATRALEDQHDAQEKVRAAAIGKSFNADDSAANFQLATQREELRLVGATDEARVHALATLKATQDAVAKGYTGQFAIDYIAKQVEIADGQQILTEKQNAYNGSLTFTAEKWDIIAGKVQAAGQGMANAFGKAGQAIGDLASTYANYQAQTAKLDQEHLARVKAAGSNQVALSQETQRYALQSSGSQIAAYGDMATAAKGFFKEGSAGYEALAAAEKVYRVAQFAMSVVAMAQNIRETITHTANAAAQATADGTAGIAKQSQLPFPFNLVAMAATAAALVAAGISVFGGHGSATSHVDPGNTGTGTVLGDTSAKSDSIKNSLDALNNVNTLMLTSSRSMEASLKSIDSQIGGFAAAIVKGGDINASANVATGFKTSGIGSVLSHIPLIGNFLGSLFGTRTDITGSGLFGKSQTIGSVMSSGYDAQSYSDVEKTKKFLGIVTGRSYSTQYSNLDPSLDNQFTLILKSFDQAIAAAAGPLGEATDAVQARLNSFVVNIGKIDLKGLSGDDIQKKLENVFGALGDEMASYVFPNIAQFQKVGEGALETLTRVASTVEAVTADLAELGHGSTSLGIAAKVALAGQFNSISDFTGATDAYFQAFYTKEEQAAAKTAQFADVFASLGLAMPSTLAGFRALVDAQDLTTAAGQSTYATLLKLAPAFSDLQASLNGAKSAADILSERTNLQRQLLDIQGNTAAIRALDLASVDASNRVLQQQVWAAQDAKDAATAAKQLADAWTSVGDSITAEIARIRGLSDAGTIGGFAQIMGQFNAATDAARAGDQDAAKSLPGLSQALLTAAQASATSRQELARVQAQTAASLEATNSVISRIAGASTPSSTGTTDTTLLATAATTTQASAPPAAANDDLLAEVKALRQEVVQLRSDTNTGQATVAANTGKTAKLLDAVTQANGGEAVSTVPIAA